MALRRPAPPVPAADDPKRREWAVGALRIWGARLLTSDDDRMAWSIAWRLFAFGDAPCPIPERLFAEITAELPAQRLYPLVLGEWRRVASHSGEPGAIAQETRP
jgi:hypothetical protein